MDRHELIHDFDLDHDLAFHQHVQTITLIQTDIFVNQG